MKKQISMRLKFWLFSGLLLLIPAVVFSQNADSLARPVQLNGYLTEEQFKFYQADYFPLSLAERGRLAVSSYRGMPPGFYQYTFDGKTLDNPFMGFWNEQWIPRQRLAGRNEMPLFPVIWLQADNISTFVPTTDITYHQDFTTGLSYLDIEFNEHLTKENFIQLAGNNFVRDGTLPAQLSRIQVNTYQGRLHLRLHSRWMADANFWQMRHRFNLPPPGLTGFTGDKYKQISNLLWIQFQGQLSGRDSLVILPEFNQLNEDYWQQNVHFRELRARWGGGRFKYIRHRAAFQTGIELSGHQISQDGRFFWRDQSETQTTAGLFFEKNGNLTVHGSAGIIHHSRLGQQWTAAGAISVQADFPGTLRLHAFRDAQPVPLLWRSLQGDSIPDYTQQDFIIHQGAAFSMEKNLTANLLLHLEPYVIQTTGYPIFLTAGQTWESRNFENSGIRAMAVWNLWRFIIQNEFSWNRNFREVFAPRYNYIFTLETELSLIKNALRLQGTFIGRIVGDYQLVEFNRLLYHYQLLPSGAGPLYLSDFILQAHIKNATLFFVSENILSEDYVIVSDFGEFYRLFRIGVQWRLFE